MAYSLAGLENLWVAAGGPASAAPQAAAVASAESSGNPVNPNYTDPNGGSFGLWQINGVHASSLVAAGLPNWATDPLQNAEAAVMVWKGAGNTFWTPTASGKSATGPWAAEGIPGSAGAANYAAAMAKINAGDVGSVPQLGTGSRPGQGLAGAVGQPSTTPGQTVAQQTGSQAVQQVQAAVVNPLTAGITTLQTSWSTFWTAHPAWMILAGIVLLILAWSLVQGSNGGTTVNLSPAAASEA